jgi:hypothetical protein
MLAKVTAREDEASVPTPQPSAASLEALESEGAVVESVPIVASATVASSPVVPSTKDASASEEDAGASVGGASLNPLLSTPAFPPSATLLPPSLDTLGSLELEHSVRQIAVAPAAIETAHALTLQCTTVAMARMLSVRRSESYRKARRPEV